MLKTYAFHVFMPFSHIFFVCLLSNAVQSKVRSVDINFRLIRDFRFLLNTIRRVYVLRNLTHGEERRRRDFKVETIPFLSYFFVCRGYAMIIFIGFSKSFH